MKLVLASQSRRRIDIFNKLGLDFIVAPAEIDEDINYKYPLLLPAKLAELKAESVSLNHPDLFTVGADTLVFIENNILGKPKNYDEAFRFLHTLSGKWHSVISGVCITKYSEKKKIVFSVESKVKFKALNDKTITDYISKVNPLDKAGGYAIQECKNIIVEKIDGSFDNIMGFPTEKFLEIYNLLK